MKQAMLILVFLGVALFATEVQACFCIREEVPKAFESAKAVFLGEVTEIIEPKSSDETAPLSLRLFVIKFKVIRSWKGAGFGSQEISVLGNQGRLESPELQIGLRYLVFTDRVANEQEWGVLGMCNRTTVVPPDLVPSKSSYPSANDPFFDMRQLDALDALPVRLGALGSRGAVQTYSEQPELQTSEWRCLKIEMD